MTKDVIDLFSGCGGFSLGAELAGFRTRIAVDIDKDLHSSFHMNFPNAEVVRRDISEIDGRYWWRKLGAARPAGVIGGPPCQGFSRIGKRDPNDPRNTLIGHFFRHVQTIRPKFFVMENVEGLLDEGLSDTLFDAIESVRKKYRVIGPLLVNAGDFGAPTDRKRVIIVGYDPEELEPLTPDDFAPTAGTPQPTVRDAISDLPEPIPGQDGSLGWATYPSLVGRRRAYAEICRELPPPGLGWAPALEMLKSGQVSGVIETVHTKEVRKRFALVKPGETDPVSHFPRLAWERRCPTLRAGTGNDRGKHQSARPIHPDAPRVISIREAARLQGFPDWFVFHPTKWHSFRMIGNSVSPFMSRHILSVLNAKF